jgi:hypothetical protein
MFLARATTSPGREQQPWLEAAEEEAVGIPSFLSFTPSPQAAKGYFSLCTPVAPCSFSPRERDRGHSKAKQEQAS